MGDLIGVDFKSKKRLGHIETPLQEGLSIIAQAMAGHNAVILDRIRGVPANVPNPNTLVDAGCPINAAGIDGLAWPGMDVQSPYMSPDKDPA